LVRREQDARLVGAERCAADAGGFDELLDSVLAGRPDLGLFLAGVVCRGIRRRFGAALARRKTQRQGKSDGEGEASATQCVHGQGSGGVKRTIYAALGWP